MDITKSMNVEETILAGNNTDGTDQFLTFMLSGEEYGVDILRVVEIKGWNSVTSIPNTPEYMRGVLNLRGTIVPIIDMRLRFGMEHLEYGPTTVVIMVKVYNGDASRIMGIVVDAVSDVYSIPEEQIKSAPDFGSGVDTAFIRGLATVEEKMVIVLDVDKMLNSQELADIDRISEE